MYLWLFGGFPFEITVSKGCFGLLAGFPLKITKPEALAPSFKGCPCKVYQHKCNMSGLYHEMGGLLHTLLLEGSLKGNQQKSHLFGVRLF